MAKKKKSRLTRINQVFVVIMLILSLASVFVVLLQAFMN
ncbi:DUF4044 domain-containing protein [Weissella diestrammenae]|uniref:DUF4044 domain-containing protein n=1 Tax=Weissella diestrammenae TaxID=1162633 RepID=A0A7G9T656_9LACO|nr:DUF4044 domain-containing protein [Weissella diestrammenae]MCM0582421.1 DUF4044 domain-containing protein [Weissella diestrammenae]QNN75581.1 DUF4044 domain-containing protein [Weissella diestrammenae]